MGDLNFNPESVQNYRKMQAEKNNRASQNNGFNIDAVLSIFDKDGDGKISKSEFGNITEEQYNKFTQQLKEYNSGKDENQGRILDYKNLAEFLDDGVIEADEIAGKAKQTDAIDKSITISKDLTESNGGDNKVFGENSAEYGLKDKNLPEMKGLKDLNTMTKEELLAEYKSYGLTPQKDNIKAMQRELYSIRKEAAQYDKGSDEVDGHIGSFVQGDHNDCTLLEILEGMSDEQVRSLYKKKTDDNGKVYYEVTFPQDKAGGQSVVVTQEEIDSGSVTVEENGKPVTYTDLAKGDKDVNMFEIAFIKRFGGAVFKNGAYLYETKNKFTENDKDKLTYNKQQLTEQDLENLPQNTIAALMDQNDKAKHGIKDEPFTLENGKTFTFDIDFGNPEIGRSIKLSDGTTIDGGHAYSVHRYDKATKEVILGDSGNATFEIRVPYDLFMKYFEIA